MHPVSEMGTSVPAFLGKLWRLVEDPETDDLICWAPNGRSFFIRNQAQFARELLPHYYKHNNMASFVRQLNMYGFHKKVSVELGGLKCDRDEMEFAHQYFCKDHPYLLEHIKRKIASNKTQDPSQAPMKPELMNKMLTEVRSMRGRQEHFDSRLGAMKQENEALWRELAVLRQKHQKQQHIVDKLIHFLVSLVQPNRNSGLSMKRRYPLMIDDRQRLKQSKAPKMQKSPTGPAIHELDASDPDLQSEYIVAEMLDSDQIATIESPEHSSVADDNMSEYYVDEPVQLPQEIEECQDAGISKKRNRNKKKGEETLLLEVPQKVNSMPSTLARSSGPAATTAQVFRSTSPAIAISNVKPTTSKPVPLATVRSSKLAAMAANIKKNQEPDIDLDLELDTEETEPKDDSLQKLEDVLIVPEIMSEEYLEKNNGNTAASSVSSLSTTTTNDSPRYNGSPDANDMGQGSFGNLDFRPSEFSNFAQEKQTSVDATDHNGSKSMSLSRVNPGSMSETNYRLSSMDEVDTHLDSMQSELDNLREILRGEGYSIDANTLLGLFGGDDPMSFAIPVNPDLDPRSNPERGIEDDEQLRDKGELMTYNSSPGLLDFDDDIFLGASSSSPGVPTVTDVTNQGPSSDPIELVDSKGNIFDSLIANNTNSPQT